VLSQSLRRPLWGGQDTPASVDIRPDLAATGRGFDFGLHVTESRLPTWMNSAPPGPGDYQLQSSIGPQVAFAGTHNRVTAPTVRFGSELTINRAKLWGGSMELSVAGAETPGVKHAHGKTHASRPSGAHGVTPASHLRAVRDLTEAGAAVACCVWHWAHRPV
jgi:hypothetical protein